MAENSPQSESDPTATVAWKQWCRLCAKDDAEGNVSVFCKNDQNVADTSLATAIGKYFWVTIKIDDELSKCLCKECHQLVTSLVTFTERVNKVQAMFCMLASSGEKLNASTVRKQFDLLDETREHVITTERTGDRQRSEDIHEEDTGSMQETLEVEQTEFADLQVVEITEDLHNEPSEVEVDVLEAEESDTADEAVADNINLKAESSDENEQLEGMEFEIGDDDVQTLTIEHDGENAKAGDEIDDSDIFKELNYKADVADDSCDSEEMLESMEDSIHIMEETPAKRRRGRPSKQHSKPKRIRSLYDSEDTEHKYECMFCGKKYKNPTSYRKHMSETHKVEPDIPDFACEKCSKVLPTERQLAAHMRTHLSLEEKLSVPCPCCEKKFTKVVVMQQHVRCVHNNEKMFICDECGKGLKTMGALSDHKKIHDDASPYECSHCHKGFKTKARLKVHVDTHTETAYICNVCGQQLNTQRTLKSHMLVHSEDRRYKCDFCNSEFKRSKALKNHLILHTGLRPYKCNFCGKAFANGSNCRSHKKKLHPRELAAEEALGRKATHTRIPKIDELRSPSMAVRKPRVVNRTPGGLPQRMRDLLKQAEERAKLSREQNDLNSASKDSTESGPNSSVESEFAGTIELHEGDLLTEEDEEETVIYEIIDEI